MRMFNADGSEAEMCGNGVRCVAKYVYDHGIARKPTLTHRDRPRRPDARVASRGRQGRSASRVDMGEPDSRPAADSARRCPAIRRLTSPLAVAGRELAVTCVLDGQPALRHVLSTSRPTNWSSASARMIETPRAFPRRINVEFVAGHQSRNESAMRTWERGSGETLACGTGACAVCVAGVLTGRTERQVTVHLPGGDLRNRLGEADNHVYMTGPAVEVFSGRVAECRVDTRAVRYRLSAIGRIV